MDPEDVCCGTAGYDSRIDKFTALDLENHGTGEAGILGPCDRSQCDHRIDERAAHDTGDGDRKDDAREGDHHISDTHDDDIDDAAEVSGNDAHRGAYDEDAGYEGDDGGQGVARAVEDTGEYVTSELVCAEEMRRRRCLVRILHDSGERVIRSDDRSKECDRQKKDDQKRGEAEGFIFFEAFD